MKKILILLSALLLVFSACGSSNYNKVVKETEEYLQKLANDDKDLKLFSFGETNKEVLKTENRVLELKDVDFKLKSSSDLVLGSIGYTQALTIMRFEGDLESYFDSRKLSTTYCLIDDVVIIDYNSSEDIAYLCEKLDGEYEDKEEYEE